MRDNQYYLRNLYGQRDLENYYLSMNAKETSAGSKKVLNLSQLIKRNLERQRNLPIHTSMLTRQRVRPEEENQIKSQTGQKFKSIYVARPQTGQVNFLKRSFVGSNQIPAKLNRINHSSDQKHRPQLNETGVSNKGTITQTEYANSINPGQMVSSKTLEYGGNQFITINYNQPQINTSNNFYAPLI